MPGTIYLVATPIGNLQDMTFRAVETLKSVDLIACEDTRHTRKLLNHFGISAKLVSYHEHNEAERTRELVRRLDEGDSVAVVSDAGTPGISDPGFRIVQAAREAGVRIVPIPGPTAFVNAAVVSGLPTDSLFFGGFLPSKTGDRRRRLEEVSGFPATLAFYEAPHRLQRSLGDCLEILGNRTAAIARELTKIHEEIVVGNLSELREKFRDTSVKGEIVLVVERWQPAPETQAETSLADRIAALEQSGLDHKSALKQAARERGLSKSDVYRSIHSEKK